MNTLPRTKDDARSRIMLPLDVPDLETAESLVDRLGPSITTFKIGLELWSRGGSALAETLARRGHAVFADLKLCDIPNTVAAATRNVAGLGCRFLTVHEPCSSVEAASHEVGEQLELLGVTYLTSMSPEEARLTYGIPDSTTMEEATVAKGRRLVEAGCGGLVSSPLEVAALRAALPDATLVTPGIRPAGSSTGDQKRTAGPRQAAAAGADYLVVGRPIRDAADPAAAADAIVEEAWLGWQERIPAA